MKRLLSVAICIFVVLSALLLPVSAAQATVVTQPKNTTFYQGIDWGYVGSSVVPNYDFDLSGTVVSYNGERISYTVYPWGGNMYAEPADGSWKIGNNTVNILLDDYSGVYAATTFKLIAIKKIELTKTPTKTSYYKGTDWDYDSVNHISMKKNVLKIDGAEIKVTYTDNSSKVLTYGVDSGIDWNIPNDEFSLGENRVNVTYYGFTSSYNINIVTNTLKNVTLKNNPSKTTYDFKTDWNYSGSNISIPQFNLNGMEVNFNYSDSSVQTVSYATSPKRFSAKAISALKLGDNTIRVTVDGTYSFDYTIKINGYGDIDFNGKINSSDALLVLQKSVGLVSFNSLQNKYADVSGDGVINSTDALYILNKSVGKVDKFNSETK